MKEIITRDFVLPIEVREDGDQKRHITGLIPYDKNSEDLGGFIEVIRKGAFSKTIKESNVRCLWAHNTQYVLGNTAAKSLSLEDRNDGLYFDVLLPDTSWAGDVYETVKRGDAPGVSFGFSVVKDAWTTKSAKEPDLRELLEVRLYEVSVGVAFPAYPDSTSQSSTRELFGKNGIEIEKIASVLLRAEGGKIKAENEDDLKLLRSAIESLSSFIPETRDDGNEPPEGTPDVKPSADTYNQNSRILDILEAEKFDL